MPVLTPLAMKEARKDAKMKNNISTVLVLALMRITVHESHNLEKNTLH
jgi:hypothetical protein